MCAQYGINGRVVESDFPIIDDRTGWETLVQWLTGSGEAKITGVNARNLNPVIVGGTIQLGWWSLWIGGQLKKGYSTFNARDDKLTTSTWWREPFAHTRALLPATWFIEKGKRFELGHPFAIAAIYNTQRDGLLTYSMVTRDAIGQAKTANNRMPLILPESMHETWLDPEQVGDEGLRDAAVAASEEVSAAVAIV
ncbi:SOS response-associated peptidase family protein [Gryllotalpicola sp.]|uniref:SOS response-associated peptidase family protein n=1 Tax=Gryllotalpicola sp. TaxID=1932787 RepID=UPI00263512D7|nr:SOS response-associated peptidase family protein [Gryllotalpicola sp.]